VLFSTAKLLKAFKVLAQTSKPRLMLSWASRRASWGNVQEQDLLSVFKVPPALEHSHSKVPILLAHFAGAIQL
jgi:hypothetical protein